MGRSLDTSVEILIWIGRWSELREMLVRQSQEVRMVEDVILRSGAVEELAVILGGQSLLRMLSVVSPSQLAMLWPLVSSV